MYQFYKFLQFTFVICTFFLCLLDYLIGECSRNAMIKFEFCCILKNNFAQFEPWEAYIREWLLWLDE